MKSSNMNSNDALLTINDLKNYQTSIKASGSIGATTSLPIILRVEDNVDQMLNILENFDLLNLGHNSSDYVRIVCGQWNGNNW